MAEEIEVSVEEEAVLTASDEPMEVVVEDDTITDVSLVQTVEVEAEVTEWVLASDAILIKQYTDIPQWLNDIINDAVDWTPINDRLDDMQDMLDLLGEGYTNLVAITDDQAVKLEYLASEQDGMAASIQELQITKITEDQAIAISQETIGSWLESGDAASWFDRMIMTNASLTSANAVAISNLHSELDGITSDIDEIHRTTVTKTQNPLWVDDCDYLANPGCEPSDPDQFGNPRWIYTSEAQYQLLVDANGNVAGLDIFACDSTDPTVDCETVFSIFAEKFVVKANPSQAAATSPFVINTNTSPATVAFNGEVHFLNPDDGTSSPLYDYLNDLNQLIQDNADRIQDNLDRISEIVGGMLITVDEKKELRIELDKIKDDYQAIVNQYAIYSVVPGDGQYPNLDQYEINVNALDDYLVNVILIDDLSQEHQFADETEYNEFVQKFSDVYISNGLALTDLVELAKQHSEEYADQIMQDISLIVSDEVVNTGEKRQLQTTWSEMNNARNSLIGSYGKLGYFLPQSGMEPDPEVQYLYDYSVATDELDAYLHTVIDIQDLSQDTNLNDVGSSPQEFIDKFDVVFQNRSLAEEHLTFIIDAKAYGYSDSAYRRAQDMSLDGLITVEEKKLLQLDYDRINDHYNAIEARFANLGISPCPTYETDPGSCPPYSINLGYYQARKVEVLDYLDNVIGIHDDPLAETPLNDDEILEFNDKFYQVYHYQELAINDYTVAYDEAIKELVSGIIDEVNDIASDGWIHPTEKAYLKNTLAGIRNQYTGLETSFAWLGIDPDTPVDQPFPGSPGGVGLKAYRDQINVLAPYLEDTDKCNINEAVATELASFGSNPDEFTQHFNDVFTDGAGALADFNEALDVKLQGQINDAIEEIEAIAGDNLITVGEKADLQVLLQEIQTNTTALRGQFFIFGVDNPDATYPPQDPPPSDIENQLLFDYQLEERSISFLLENVIQINDGQPVELDTLQWEGNTLTPQIFIDEFTMYYSKQQQALEELMRVSEAYYDGKFTIIDNEINDIDTRLTQAEQDLINLEQQTNQIADDGWVIIKEKKDLRIVHNDLLEMRNHIEARYAAYGILPGQNALLDEVIASWDILDPYLSNTDQLNIFAADDVIDDTELTLIGSSRDDFNNKFNAVYSAVNAVLDDIDNIISGDLSRLDAKIDDVRTDLTSLQNETDKIASDSWIIIQEKRDLQVIHSDLEQKEINVRAQYAIYGIDENSGHATLDEVIAAWTDLDDYLTNTVLIFDDPLVDTQIDRNEYNSKFDRMYAAFNAVLSDLEDLLDSDLADQFGTLEGKVELLKTLSVFGQEQAKETYGDGIVDVDEKIYFIGYKSVMAKEYQLAVFGYQAYGINPGDDPASKPPYAVNHQQALNNFQTRYDELINYLDNTLLVDDTSTDTPIPDEQEYVERFTNFYTSRDICYEYMTNISFDDIGAPDGGTIIDGGHIKTGTIETDHLQVNIELSSPVIHAGYIRGTTIEGVNISGSVIHGSYIDLSGSNYFTSWKHYHDGRPDGSGTPFPPPAEYEDNYARDSGGNLLPDSEGYYRLVTEQKQENGASIYSIVASPSNPSVVDDNVDITGIYNYDADQIFGKKVIEKNPQISIISSSDEWVKLIESRQLAYKALQMNGYVLENNGTFKINDTEINIYQYFYRSTNCGTGSNDVIITVDGIEIFNAQYNICDTFKTDPEYFNAGNIELYFEIETIRNVDQEFIVRIFMRNSPNPIRLNYLPKRDIFFELTNVSCNIDPSPSQDVDRAEFHCYTENYNIESVADASIQPKKIIINKKEI